MRRKEQLRRINELLLACLFVCLLESIVEMSPQFKRKRRSGNLRKNEDVSSEEEVTVVADESKKQKVTLVNTT